MIQSSTTLLLGVDFTSAPRRRKPITVAFGLLSGSRVSLQRLSEIPNFESFETLLNSEGPWIGGFDFPFGLPRAFAQSICAGLNAVDVVRELRTRCVNRMAFRALIDSWGNNRAPGTRLLHRKTDVAMDGIRSTSPLQTRYVPVGFMHFEGMPRLADAGVALPGIAAGDASRVALEAYPGLLAYELIGRRGYKNRDDTERLIARKELLQRLELGGTRLSLRLSATDAQRDALVADASGDRLDAVLCLMQAAWASMQPNWGMPAEVDPLEGWIATAPTG